VVVGALDVERISAFEAKYDPILVVDSHGVEPSQIGAKAVQAVTGRHLQIVKPSHRVDLIEFATHVGPELARNPPSCLTVDAVPDVPGRFTGERPDHWIAL
jgi:hypothetical protein